ncbi:MAG TPA: WYL domain-containing protein [Vicinamibacterales bacterium]|nr:WYL domain-containing protein [Vicinamibacterales bacterium]
MPALEAHPSQRLHRLEGGGLLLELQVSIDMALRRWILGLGAQARVLAPARLAAEIIEELQAACHSYAKRAQRVRGPVLASPRQPLLPFGELHVLTLVSERVA